MICVIGILREELAGTKIEDPRSFELKAEFITPDGQAAIDAWFKVLKAIMPTVTQRVPAGVEDYQVVRSTDHMQTVATATQGIVAGVEIFQTSFEELRRLLRLPRQSVSSA